MLTMFMCTLCLPHFRLGFIIKRERWWLWTNNTKKPEAVINTCKHLRMNGNNKQQQSHLQRTLLPKRWTINWKCSSFYFGSKLENTFIIENEQTYTRGAENKTVQIQIKNEWNTKVIASSLHNFSFILCVGR